MTIDDLRPAEFPLTTYQRDIWVATALHPDSTGYNVADHQRFEGVVDLERLLRCVRDAFGADDAWRLRFGERAGVPYQWLSDEPPPVSVVDLGGQDPAEWIEAALRRPGPPVRAVVLVVSPSVTHLCVFMWHIVADGWSGALLSEWIWRAYQGAAPAPVQPFSAYGQQERAYRASPAWETDREYFRAALDGVEPTLFGRRAGARSERHAVTLDHAIADAIRDRGHNLYAYLLAAFAIVLSRLHNSGEVVLGVPLLNRRGAQKRIIGQFANTLPLRIGIPDRERSLDEFVADVGTALFGLRRHSRLALGDVPRDPAGQLFDVTVSYLPTAPAETAGGVTRTRRPWAGHHPTDAMNVYIWDRGRGADLEIDLCSARDVQPVLEFFEQLRTVIGNGLRPGQTPTGIALTADIAVARGPEIAYPADATVQGLFARQRALSPDATAVVDTATGETLTYAELDERAELVARGLHADGVRPEDRVAVRMRRGVRLPVALFGVLKAGAAYVPVDPGYPTERIEFLLADSRPAAVIGDGPLPRSDTAAVAGTGRLAYVIYTSGSTGRPNGVMVEHRSVVNRLRWMQRAYPLDARDTLLQKTPTSFDVSVWELFWWSLAGARLAVPPPGAEKDPRELLRAVAEYRVTVLHFVPAMLGPFLDLLVSDPLLVDRCASLRLVFSSGEALTPELVRRFHRVLGRLPEPPRLVNLYGPTEATVDVSHFACPATPGDLVPIGKPVDNTQLYVLDRWGNAQPTGVAGELHIGGVQVARGYLDRPDLTRSRFLDDPFTPGGRLYRTGDIVRLLSDGNLEYLGRADAQVKIRGNRVETGEVVSALRTVPGVQDTVVFAAGDTRLMACFVADRDITPGELRAALGRFLPDYMIPAGFRRIEAVPLSPSGKVDLKALTGPEPAGAPPHRAPAGENEVILAQEWAAVLGVERVDPTADFYALGGDSLLMLQVRAACEARGRFFSLADFAANPTVAALAAKLTSGRADSDRPAAVRLARIEPCTQDCRDDAAPTVSRALRALRWSGVTVVFLGGLMMIPLVQRWLPRRQGALLRRWVGAVLACIGLRVSIDDPGPAPGGELVVGNHVSWLDTALICLARRGHPMIKTEGVDWPRALDRALRRLGTVFFDRDRPEALPSALHEVTGLLADGGRVLAFPESTTYCGKHHGTFHPALFRSAIDAQAAVQPVEIRYLLGDERPTAVPAFLGDEHVFASLRRIIATRGLTARVSFRTAFPATGDRRELARRAHDSVFAHPGGR